MASWIPCLKLHKSPPTGPQSRQLTAIGRSNPVYNENPAIFFGAGAGDGYLFPGQGLGSVADLKGDRHVALRHFVGNSVQGPAHVDHVVHMVVQVQV